MGKRGRKTRWKTLEIPDEENDTNSDESTSDVASRPRSRHYASNTLYNYKYSNYNPQSTYSSQTRKHLNNRETKPASNNSSSNNCNGTKITFNEDEYTRITTPRQDVLFKKGYLNRPKGVYQSQTSTGGSTASVSSPGNSTGNSTENGTPDHHSMDLEYESQFVFPNGFIDHNGIYFVNSVEAAPYPLMIFNPATPYYPEYPSSDKTKTNHRTASLDSSSVSVESGTEGTSHNGEVINSPQEHPMAPHYGNMLYPAPPGYYYNNNTYNPHNIDSLQYQVKKRRRRRKESKTSSRDEGASASESTDDEDESSSYDHRSTQNLPDSNAPLLVNGSMNGVEEEDSSIVVIDQTIDDQLHTPIVINNDTNTNTNTNTDTDTDTTPIKYSNNNNECNNYSKDETSLNNNDSESAEKDSPSLNLENETSAVKSTLKPDAEEFVPRSFHQHHLHHHHQIGLIENVPLIKVAPPNFIPLPIFNPTTGEYSGQNFTPYIPPGGYFVNQEQKIYSMNVLPPNNNNNNGGRYEPNRNKQGYNNNRRAQNKNRNFNIAQIVSKLEKEAQEQDKVNGHDGAIEEVIIINGDNSSGPGPGPDNNTTATGTEEEEEEAATEKKQQTDETRCKQGENEKTETDRVDVKTDPDQRQTEHDQSEKRPIKNKKPVAKKKYIEPTFVNFPKANAPPIHGDGTQELVDDPAKTLSKPATPGDSPKSPPNRYNNYKKNYTYNKYEVQYNNHNNNNPKERYYNHNGNGTVNTGNGNGNGSPQNYKRYNNYINNNNNSKKAPMSSYTRNIPYEQRRNYPQSNKTSSASGALSNDKAMSPINSNGSATLSNSNPVRSSDDWIAVGKKKRRNKIPELAETESIDSERTDEPSIIKETESERTEPKEEIDDSCNNEVPDFNAEIVNEIVETPGELIERVEKNEPDEGTVIVEVDKSNKTSAKKTKNQHQHQNQNQKKINKRIIITDNYITVEETKTSNATKEEEIAPVNNNNNNSETCKIKSNKQTEPAKSEIKESEYPTTSTGSGTSTGTGTETKGKKKKKKSKQSSSDTDTGATVANPIKRTKSPRAVDIFATDIPLLSDSEEKTNIEISQEFDKIIQKRIYSNLESKIKSSGSGSSSGGFSVDFFESMLKSSNFGNKSTSSDLTSLLKDSNNFPKSSLNGKFDFLSNPFENQSKDFLSNNVPVGSGDCCRPQQPAAIDRPGTSKTPPDEADKRNLYPITEAVKNWMIKTRENTPEVEILKSPETLYKEFVSGQESDEEIVRFKVEPAAMNGGSASFESVEQDILEYWENDVVAAENGRSCEEDCCCAKHKNGERTGDGEEEIEIYESSYGKNDDLRKLRSEIHGTRNFPKHGDLPYRAICCSIMSRRGTIGGDCLSDVLVTAKIQIKVLTRKRPSFTI